MVVRRLAATVLLLALVVGVAWWLQDGPSLATAGGMHGLEIRGPSNVLVWRGNVTLGSGGSVLGALQQGAAAGNFTVGMDGALVTRIGTYAQEPLGGGGWNYCVGLEGRYEWVPMAAGDRVLHPGEDVLWVWVMDGGNGCDAQ